MALNLSCVGRVSYPPATGVGKPGLVLLSGGKTTAEQLNQRSPRKGGGCRVTGSPTAMAQNNSLDNSINSGIILM